MLTGVAGIRQGTNVNATSKSVSQMQTFLTGLRTKITGFFGVEQEFMKPYTQPTAKNMMGLYCYHLI